AGLGVTGVAIGQIAAGVGSAQQRAGSPPDVLAPGFSRSAVALGSQSLENPASFITRYGYLSDSASQSSGLETKTEPDQNTYLVSQTNPGGPAAGFDYGRHFLVQGHELFSSSSAGVGHSNSAYFTRVNLDLALNDPHRITLLSKPDANGNTGSASIDGSNYDPFTGDLVFTGEGNNRFGGVFVTKFNWSSGTAPDTTQLLGQIGTAGYEGVELDDKGDVYLVEDSGGAGVTDNGTATRVKQPNSFLFRFKPDTPGDLSKGTLQALQVSVDGRPMVFHTTGTGPRDDALGPDIARLHSGERLETTWVTVHDTAVDGTSSFNANQKAKDFRATPFKRPENGKFVPESDFRSFVFTETGDTDRGAGESPGAATRGAWGALLRLDLDRAGGDQGTVRAVVNGDAEHNSFDNVTFLDKDTVLTGEDRGDTLHQQLNALDSLWSFDLTQPLDRITGAGKRVIAQGRDPQATDDVAKKEATPPIADQNDGDNETTGIHVSDGSMSAGGILGAKDPAKLADVRVFMTNQHGSNTTYEYFPPAGASGGGSQGPAGPQGPAGSQGPAGDQGPAGPEGEPGAQGDMGVMGDTGPEGPAGQDGQDGRDAKVVCKSRGRRKVTCKVTFAGRARLQRGGRVYARGRSARTLKAIRKVRHGRYTLVLGRGRGARRMAVVLR
ncbi:MAG: hypothetical protein ACR2NB_00985, partial [Solirubrobacteraceae bacterium]